MFYRRIGSSDALLAVRDQTTLLAEVFLSLDMPQREKGARPPRAWPIVLRRWRGSAWGHRERV